MATRGRNKFTTPKSAGLIITSLIDFFSIVIIYLMKSYSSDGSTLTLSNDLSLPNSISQDPPPQMLVQIAATEKMILLDNNPIVPTKEVENIPQTEGNPIIKKLKERLDLAVRQQNESLKKGDIKESEKLATIQMDKNVSFDVLYKIMNTCTQAKFEKMNFAVMGREM